jgi:NADH:ubiquinone oxidoreductase subunit 5 (subunit L)/multisubunit Na+/H+ antiporter MnhA subunit
LGREQDHAVVHHAHDPTPAAKAVLLVLLPFTLSLPWTAGSWLDHALRAPHGEPLAAAHHAATILALALLIAGSGFAFVVFVLLPARGVDAAAALARRLRRLHAACAELWGIDRLWDLVFTRYLGAGGGRWTARLDLGSEERLARLEQSGRPAFAIASLDELIDGVGRACGRIGQTSSRLHAGRVGTYVAVAAVVGTVVLLWGLLL